ncbi:hypothetical protein OGAPHI_001539 [Ogataea philodendri]|uniref:SHSP domain-containing protein n=1 Tax=Ogataea philodendri TaxID=1378263 RepID=A0A9P8PBW6_9ASCO|nr:uncharacterized protein OGAPHI_001539 [Ogataea philodendri]KAH3669418.1 hypothetical protein OGAPHI_001539 [Ogataea philodendri]
MSYYNDPFYSFFENINQEVAQMNNLFNDPFFRTPLAPVASGNKRLEGKSKDGKEVAQRGGGSDVARSSSWLSDSFAPPIDVHETDKAYEVAVAIPGAPKENVTIDYNKKTNELIVKGEIPARTTESDKSYSERTVGKFSRVLKLPVQVDGEKIGAKFENGLLNLNVPKLADGEDLHRIEISSTETYGNVNEEKK